MRLPCSHQASAVSRSTGKPVKTLGQALAPVPKDPSPKARQAAKAQATAALHRFLAEPPVNTSRMSDTELRKAALLDSALHVEQVTTLRPGQKGYKAEVLHGLADALQRVRALERARAQALVPQASTAVERREHRHQALAVQTELTRDQFVPAMGIASLAADRRQRLRILRDLQDELEPGDDEDEDEEEDEEEEEVDEWAEEEKKESKEEPKKKKKASKPPLKKKARVEQESKAPEAKAAAAAEGKAEVKAAEGKAAAAAEAKAAPPLPLPALARPNPELAMRQVAEERKAEEAAAGGKKKAKGKAKQAKAKQAKAKPAARKTRSKGKAQAAAAAAAAVDEAPAM